MKTLKLHGIVLSRRNSGEGDRLLTIFTAERGKIQVVAKGVRKISSRRAPHLEPFHHIELVVYSGKSLFQLTEVRTVSSLPANLDLPLLGYYFYLGEIVDKLLPLDLVQPEVFNLLSQAFENRLDERLLKVTLVKLLRLLGYLPVGVVPRGGLTKFLEEIVERPIKSKKFLDEIYSAQ